MTSKKGPDADGKSVSEAAGPDVAPLYLTINESYFTASKRILSKTRFFQKRFSDSEPKKHTRYTVDEADAKFFWDILRYLREGQFPLYWARKDGFDLEKYAALHGEASFWGIDRMMQWINLRLYERAVICKQYCKEYNYTYPPPARTGFLQQPVMTIGHPTIIGWKSEANVAWFCPREVPSHHEKTDCDEKCLALLHGRGQTEEDQYKEVREGTYFVETTAFKLNMAALIDDGKELTADTKEESIAGKKERYPANQKERSAAGKARMDEGKK